MKIKSHIDAETALEMMKVGLTPELVQRASQKIIGGSLAQFLSHMQKLARIEGMSAAEELSEQIEAESDRLEALSPEERHEYFVQMYVQLQVVISAAISALTDIYSKGKDSECDCPVCRLERENARKG